MPHPELVAALALTGAALCWLLLAGPELGAAVRGVRGLLSQVLGLDHARSELIQAELAWLPPPLWLVTRIALAVLAGIAGYLLFGMIVLGVVAAAAAYYLTGAALASRRQSVTARRQQALLEAIRHGISVMSTAGSALQMLQALARGGPVLTQGLFCSLLDEIESDEPDALRTAVERMTRRLHDPLWDDIATALRLHWSRGGKLVPALEAVADEWQETLRMRREAKALRAGVEASVLILTVLPFALLLLIHLEAPVLLQPLTTAVGQIVVAAVVGWMLLGYRVLHRVAEPPDGGASELPEMATS